MKFIIGRVSMWNAEKPCEGAVMEDRKLTRINSKPKIVKRWVIEINTLEELLVLSDKMGYPLIIDKDFIDGEPRRIEIYDDYME